MVCIKGVQIIRKSVTLKNKDKKAYNIIFKVLNHLKKLMKVLTLKIQMKTLTLLK